MHASLIILNSSTKSKILAVKLKSMHPSFNPFTAEFSDALRNASEKPLYQISHTIYLLETIHIIVPYELAKPKTFLD